MKDLIKSILERTNSSGLTIAFSSMSLTVKEESILYPFSSLFGDIGGSLGLFIGFSLLTFGETIMDFSKYFLSFLSKE